MLLANDICDMFKVRHIEDEEDGAVDELSIANYVRRDDLFVLLVTLRQYVDDLDTRVQVHWLVIDAKEKTIVLWMIACFAINILDGIAKVEAECGLANNVAVDLASRVMPMDLVKMRFSTFISEVIELCKAQLQVTAWTDDESNAIENDHRELPRRIGGRTTSCRSLTSTITQQRSTRHGTCSVARGSTSCATSAPGW